MEGLPRISDFDDPGFDPFDEDANPIFGHVEDIYGRLREVVRSGGLVQEGSLRLMGGVPRDITYPQDQRTFVVFDRDLIREVLSDTATYSNDVFKPGIRPTFGNSLTQMNPPEHPLYRKIFQAAFLPHKVADWSDAFITPAIDELMGRFQDRGRAELIREFAFPYPFEIIYRQLALPVEDRQTFHRLAVTQTFFQHEAVHSAEAGRKLGDFFQALLDERRAQPGPDIVSVLAHTEVDGEYLPDDVVVSFLRQLINAAGDTTYRSTGNMLVGLLRDRPDQYAMVAADRSLVAKAIDETLRWEGPVNMSMRTVMRDVELGGVHISAGSVVETATGYSARDERFYRDPDRFDLLREDGPKHMAFSYGPHVCLGQHLARLEMTRALNAILDHLPKLRLDPDHPPPTIHGYSMRRTGEIHVLFDRRPS